MVVVKKDRTPSVPGANKTYGHVSPALMFEKLRYDIFRLTQAKDTLHLVYASFDCAMDAWHLTDWVLSSVSDEAHLRLCGKMKSDRQGKARGFIEHNRVKLPLLEVCEKLANSAKHLIIDNDEPSIMNSVSVGFGPPFQSLQEGQPSRMFPVGKIVYGEQVIPVHDFYREVARQWSRVLWEEGLLPFHTMMEEFLSTGFETPDLWGTEASTETKKQ
ncbi:hypothetical protein [Rhizobium tubonense]|uniref:Uncharacterized protein n=1 Tax=Rhizobium tubonense TaxID=484088 RepID=A0A2W4CT89_9HYPH|nr:hypothetical protein [Rhizobium tubonense]PZM15867.1 hypothetical protein CPY51_05690 [Rhizobium tubonense]